MPRIELQTLIHAPAGIVFDLSRSIDVHQASQSRHLERAVAGRTSGLIQLGESVTWEAVHFGIKQQLSSRIVAMTVPSHFRDSMIEGAFRHIDHDHYFEVTAAGTVMRDVFDYSSPLSLLGHLADSLFLKRYLTNLLKDRNQMIKAVAESGEYLRYLSTPAAL